ncbi:MAG: hypothetical protein JXA83_13575 [Acidimicrobiales bacterium]|nr:hypothetical protein [Acidimicrobiales bacterium]
MDDRVVAHRVQPPPVGATVVEVTGALREVDATHLDEELEIDVPRDVFERFNGNLVIAATAVDD